MDKIEFIQRGIIRLMPPDDRFEDAVASLEKLWMKLTVVGYGAVSEKREFAIKTFPADPKIDGAQPVSAVPTLPAYRSVKDAPPAKTPEELAREHAGELRHFEKMYKLDPTPVWFASLNAARVKCGFSPLPDPLTESEPASEMVQA